MKNFKNGFMTTMGVLAGFVVFGTLAEYLKRQDQAKTESEESKTEETVTE